MEGRLDIGLWSFSKRHELEAADEAVGKFLEPKSAENIYRDLENSRKQAEAGEYSSAKEVFNEFV